MNFMPTSFERSEATDVQVVHDEAPKLEFLAKLREGRLQDLLSGPLLPDITDHPEYVEAFRTGFRRLLQAENLSDAHFIFDFYGKNIDMDEDIRAVFFRLLDRVDPEAEFPFQQLSGLHIFFKGVDLESAPHYAERITGVFIKLLEKKRVDQALQLREMFGMNLSLSQAMSLMRDHLIQESEACRIEDRDKPRAERKGPLHFLHIPMYRGMTEVLKIIEASKKDDLGLAAELKAEYDARVAEDGGEISFSGMFDERSPYHPHVVKGYAEVLENLSAYTEVPYEIEKSN